MRNAKLLPVSLAWIGLGLGVLGVTSGCSRVFARRQHLSSGDRVPEVAARNQDGTSVALSRYRGHPVVVYFYPKDRTSGCTIEAHDFRVDYPKFKELGVEVLGVSNDDVASHQDFCTKEGLPFPLLADPDQAMARAFGVKATLGFYQRITFVLDSDGVVRRVFDPVHPAGHAQEVLASVKGLVGAAPPPPLARDQTRP
jgi:thioredoxin-dependent peroxiredoxin